MQTDNPQADSNPYLEQEVMSASPIRLRWMLIQRAEELCGLVKQLWQDEQQPQGDGWLLRIREILGELLEGVKDQANPASKPISDFYVFLLQYLGTIERSRDMEKLIVLEELLHIENETWQLVLQKSMADINSNAQEPWSIPNVERPAASDNTAKIAPVDYFPTEFSGDFSLEV